MQESIIQYSGIASGIYEEMEVFDKEFNVARDFTGQQKIFQKEASNVHQKTGQVPCSVASVSNQFFNDIMFN